MALRVLALSSCIGSVAGSSMYLAKLCMGHTCTDEKFPILDYSEAEATCICRQHPCWNDNGLTHRCDNEEFPFLAFSFSDDRELSCSCSARPFYASTYIHEQRCAGNVCDQAEYPILDYSVAEDKCFCRAHPCWDLEGMKHECTDPMFPILRYREDETWEGSGKAKPVCECAAKMTAAPGDEL